MEKDEKGTSGDGHSACVICFRKVEIYSIGQCDHPVCYECSTRMRVLCRQNECPICRQDLPKVIFIKDIQLFEQINNKDFPLEEKYHIAFASDHIRKKFDYLLTHDCPECQKRCPNFILLREHVRRSHQLTYCDLCVDNLKILTRERRCYTRKDLAEHRRHGDPTDRSHRGHPLCKFCETRYMDNDELYRHVRRDHLFCHFCDADGIHQYYKTYESLREHFKCEHFLCEEGECFMEKFTSVFRTEIDLKAHKANEHGKSLGKAGVKHARTLDIEFSLSSRPRAYIRRSNYRDTPSTFNEEEELERYQQLQQMVPVQKQPNTECREEFPTLSGSSVVPQSHKVTATVKSNRSQVYEDYPALPSTEATVSLRVDATDRPSPSTNFSIQVNHPRFTTTLTASKAPTSECSYKYHFPALDISGPPPGLPSTATSTASGSAKPQHESKSVQWSTINSEGKKRDTNAKTPSSIQHSAYHNLRVNAAAKTPPTLEDFPALAPKPTQSRQPPPKTKPAKTANISTKTVPTANDVLPTSKIKNKKTKSKNKVTANVAGTNVKKKPTPPPPPENNAKGEPETIKEVSNKVKECKPKECGESRGDKEQMEKEVVKQVKKLVLNTTESKEDFPALGSNNVGSKAPPGFNVKWLPKRAPPGLSPPVVPVAAPPPGFSVINGTSFPPLSNGNVLGEYFPPSDFDRRNTALVGKVAKALGSESWIQFKDMSMRFRGDVISSEEYYQHCRKTMTSDTFSSLFPELLALLPDINKQQELWRSYTADKELNKKENKLKKCAVCQQVVNTGDFHEHYTKHTLDNHFPTLQRKPAQDKRPNAWAK